MMSGSYQGARIDIIFRKEISTLPLKMGCLASPST
jgi:hypothetical protein